MLTQDEIRTICAMLRQQYEVAGILLTGSYAYGQPHQRSDLDLRLVNLIGLNFHDRSTRWEGVWLHCFHETPETVRYWLEQGRLFGSESTVHCWAHGTIIYDPTGIVAALQADAQRIWAGGPVRGPWRKGSHRFIIRVRSALRRSLRSMMRSLRLSRNIG